MGHLADVAVTELTRGQKVLLTFAKAFWPRPPHVLFVPLGVVGKSKSISKEKNHFNTVTEEKIEREWYWAQIASWIFEKKVMVCFQNFNVLDVLRPLRYEPSALGLEGSALDVVMAALRSWSGGLLVATEKATQNGTWERWTLAQSELDSLSHPELGGDVPVKEFAFGEAC